jgi:hypothetical protein
MIAAAQLDFGYCDARRVRVLGAPVVHTVWHDDAHVNVEVLGAPYAGDTSVYIVHMYTPIAHARHYIGSTDDLARRMKEHQRTWPLYQLTDDAFDDLAAIMPLPILGELRSIWGRRYRRKHTFLKAVHDCIEFDAFDVALLKAARRHRSNGLLMTANQQQIAWGVARCFRAVRSFEFTLKHQKNIRRLCPVCQGHDLPF